MPAIQQVLATKQLISKPLVEKFIIWALLARHHSLTQSESASILLGILLGIPYPLASVRVHSLKYPYPVSASVGYGYRMRILEIRTKRIPNAAKDVHMGENMLRFVSAIDRVVCAMKACADRTGEMFAMDTATPPCVSINDLISHAGNHTIKMWGDPDWVKLMECRIHIIVSTMHVLGKDCENILGVEWWSMGRDDSTTQQKELVLHGYLVKEREALARAKEALVSREAKNDSQAMTQIAAAVQTAACRAEIESQLRAQARLQPKLRDYTEAERNTMTRQSIVQVTRAGMILWSPPLARREMRPCRTLMHQQTRARQIRLVEPLMHRCPTLKSTRTRLITRWDPTLGMKTGSLLTTHPRIRSHST